MCRARIPAESKDWSAASVCSGLRELWHASTIVVIPASSEATASRDYLLDASGYRPELFDTAISSLNASV